MPRNKRKYEDIQHQAKTSAQNDKSDVDNEKKIRSSLDELTSLENLSPSNRDHAYIIAVVKHGIENVGEYIEEQSNVPSCWPDPVREKLLQVNAELHELLRHHRYGNEKSPRQSQYIGPPVGRCSSCDRELTMSNKPSSIKYACADGDVKLKRHVTLRCRRCQINYRFDMSGNSSSGYTFYPEQREAIAATDAVYIDRSLYNLQWSLAQHCWVSFEGIAETYSHAFNLSRDLEIDRRTWASAFWWGEVEAELREQSLTFRFRRDSDLEECMTFIDGLRRQAPYPHPEKDCFPECKARGCGKLFVADGLWKLQFAHCMFQVQPAVDGHPLISLPPVCTAQPKPGQAFCITHCKEMAEEDPPIPTTLRGFLNYCKGSDHTLEENLESPVSDHTYAQEARDVLEDLDGQRFLRQFPEAVKGIGSTESQKTESRCSKDLGERETLRQMSRGHMFLVRAGGHIDTWTPLFRSESHGQVLLFLISWLYTVLKDVSPSKWKDLWLAYDNMCQLIRCKAAQSDCYLPAPYNKMFKSINKIIDGLHIKNHIQDSCHTDLHPDNIYDMYPELKGSRNTQAAEQTFVWLGRYKKIVCSMTKVHHLFFIHRLVTRRNKYIVRCYSRGKKPLLPGIRNSKSC